MLSRVASTVKDILLDHDGDFTPLSSGNLSFKETSQKATLSVLILLLTENIYLLVEKTKFFKVFENDLSLVFAAIELAGCWWIFCLLLSFITMERHQVPVMFFFK